MKPRKHPVSVAELERRMRPGALSQGGFLGPTESLEAVILRDAQTLEEHGISNVRVADALEEVLSRLCDLKRSSVDPKRDTDYPRLRQPDSVPSFSLRDLPDTATGYLYGYFHGFILQYRGIQECPWDCEVHPSWSSFDFLLLNRKSGEAVTGPALAVHLIRHHRFFEGVDSPYRTDPVQLIRVLELAPSETGR